MGVKCPRFSQADRKSDLIPRRPGMSCSKNKGIRGSFRVPAFSDAGQAMAACNYSRF